MQPGAPHSHHPPLTVCPASATAANGAKLLCFSAGKVENQSGRMRMQTAANISLVLTGSSSFKLLADLQREISFGGFYQQLASKSLKGVCTREALRDLGERLVVSAEHSYAFRQMEVLEALRQEGYVYRPVARRSRPPSGGPC